jgi:hypothetical protein
MAQVHIRKRQNDVVQEGIYHHSEQNDECWGDKEENEEFLTATCHSERSEESSFLPGPDPSLRSG